MMILGFFCSPSTEVPWVWIIRGPPARDEDSPDVCPDPALHIESLQVHHLTPAALQLATDQPRSGKPHGLEPDGRKSQAAPG